jgi:hypothetical protein
MSFASEYFRGSTNTFVTSLQALQADVAALKARVATKPVRTQLLVLDSAWKTAASANETPQYTLTTPITCGGDEYITLTLQRANFYHDFDDVPPNSQITFTKTGQAPFTITLDKSGKPLYGNLATLVYNKYHTAAGDASFNIVYDSTLGGFVMTFGATTTVSFPTDELARYFGYAPGTTVTSVANRIVTPPLRPQKTINVAVCLDNLTAASPALVANQYQTTLCVFPVLANPFLISNYRSYIESELAVKLTNKTINALQLRFIDTASGLTVPVKESHLTIELNVHKV